VRGEQLQTCAVAKRGPSWAQRLSAQMQSAVVGRIQGAQTRNVDTDGQEDTDEREGACHVHPAKRVDMHQKVEIW
jgi:hypothetical protein